MFSVTGLIGLLRFFVLIEDLHLSCMFCSVLDYSDLGKKKAVNLYSASSRARARL